MEVMIAVQSGALLRALGALVNRGIIYALRGGDYSKAHRQIISLHLLGIRGIAGKVRDHNTADSNIETNEAHTQERP